MIWRKQEEARQEVPGALNLVANLVGLWNMVYLQQVIEALCAEGVEVRNDDLTHLSPACFEHLNRPGKYTFLRRVEAQPSGLHPCVPQIPGPGA